MSIEIRRAGLKDLEAVLALGRRFIAGSQYAGMMGVDPDYMRPTIGGLMGNPAVTVFLATRQGEPVGLIAAAIGPNLSGELWCEELAWWVDPASRGGTRAGYRLLRRLITHARQNDCLCLKMTAPYNPELSADLLPGGLVGKLYRREGMVPYEVAYLMRL